VADLAVITDPLRALGFKLAGIRPIVAHTAEEAEASALDALSRLGRPLFLGMNEEWLAALSPAGRARLEDDPAVLPAGIPARFPGSDSSERDYLAALVRRAVGVELHWE